MTTTSLRWTVRMDKFSMFWYKIHSTCKSESKMVLLSGSSDIERKIIAISYTLGMFSDELMISMNDVLITSQHSLKLGVNSMWGSFTSISSSSIWGLMMSLSSCRTGGKSSSLKPVLPLSQHCFQVKNKLKRLFRPYTCRWNGISHWVSLAPAFGAAVTWEMTPS